MKHFYRYLTKLPRFAAAFGRLCVETDNVTWEDEQARQPPSGGCVLKQTKTGRETKMGDAAAFGRLCVETHRLTRVRRSVC